MLGYERQIQQEIISDTATDNSNTLDESELQNVAGSQAETISESEIPTVLYKNLSEPTKREYASQETGEIVFESAPQTVKKNLVVTTPVDLKPAVIGPMPTENVPKQAVVIENLKYNRVVSIKLAEFADMSPLLERTPTPEKVTQDLTSETAPVEISQRVVDKSETVFPLDSIQLVIASRPLEIGHDPTTDHETDSGSHSVMKTIGTNIQIDQEPPQLRGKKTIKFFTGTGQAQQEFEDQPARAASAENPAEVALTNSAKSVNTELEVMQLSTDIQETAESSRVVIRVVKDADRFILGIQNVQVEGDGEKIELAEIKPIITVAELGKALEYIKGLTLNIRLNEGQEIENNLAIGEQTVSEIDVVVSGQILELIEAIVEDSYSSTEPQLKGNEVINRQTVTFSTNGESDKKLVIDGRKVSQIQQLLIVLDLSPEQNLQDEEERILYELDQLDEIESLFQEIESQLKDETSELTMAVSQELMTFIEKGGKIIEETESTNTKVMQFITISSSEREIKMDLKVTKKLMKLLKKKREIDIVNYFNETQAPEEVKGNIRAYQNGNNISIWFIYHIILLLVLVDDQRYDDISNQTKVLYASAKQEVLLVSGKLIQET